MKKYQILKKNWQFQQIIKERKQIISQYLILYYQKNDSNLQVGISVSKKFLNAVYRNKIRRQVRKILTDNIEFDKYKYNVILIIRKPFIKSDDQNKIKQINNIFNKFERVKNAKKSKQ